jgi:SecD/SecF fusion protein
VTTVIAAALLFAFGTSAIQGFAVMLITSIILSIMTAVFGARLLLGLLLRSRLFDQKPHWFGVSKDQITKLGTDQERAPLYHFIGTRHKVFTGTALVLGIGILLFALFGFHAGVDFTGGTQLEIENQGVLNAELIRNELAQFEVIPSEMRQVGNDNELTRILFNETLSSIQIEEMMSQLGNQYNLEMSYSETTVSADIARELARKALWAVLFASVGIIAYVAVRFEYSMGLAAVITIFHDALIVLAVFTIFRIQVDLTFVAAILTVVGYSINDTIVLFDRIREKLRQKKIKDARHLVKLVNVSITEVLPRSIHTTVTLLIAVLALLLLGGEGIRNFSMALCIGLLTGAWSSIFIAAPLWVFFKERKELKENKLIKAA